jgi:hypothetical protein
MKHKTAIELSSPSFNIKYQDSILSMGSCFAQNIAKQLEGLCYNVSINPFGTLYNPISIRNSIGLLLNNYEFNSKDLFFHNGLWNSFQHHSSFSSPNPAVALEKINVELVKARARLQQNNTLILTFGTAWVYELRKTKKVVSNCHKIPTNRFKRRRLTIPEIVENLGPLLEYLKEKLPALNIILTVSPIRHLKDGFTENQMSKATLILAIQEMVKRASFIHYFPSYEIMMDDLRDYRYYADDLIHPSNLAIDYIWQLFANNYLDNKDELLRSKIKKIQQAVQHRSFNPTSEGHQKFVRQQIKNIEGINKKVPTLNLERPKNYFLEQLVD